MLSEDKIIIEGIFVPTQRNLPEDKVSTVTVSLYSGSENNSTNVEKGKLITSRNSLMKLKPVCVAFAITMNKLHWIVLMFVIVGLRGKI